MIFEVFRRKLWNCQQILTLKLNFWSSISRMWTALSFLMFCWWFKEKIVESSKYVSSISFRAYINENQIFCKFTFPIKVYSSCIALTYSLSTHLKDWIHWFCQKVFFLFFVDKNKWCYFSCFSYKNKSQSKSGESLDRFEIIYKRKMTF